jgi:3-oxoacyl-[acyl-carrier protein] reductase
MVGEWMEDQLGDNYDRLMVRRARLTPLRRCVTADDVADVMLALLTSMPFVNGEIVVVDGGFASTT